MDNSIKLSICIPTYNRLNKVKNQLDFLLEESCCVEGIEIIISDNCSDDGTYDYLSSIEGRYAEVSVFEQSKNLGLIGNMLFLIREARGEYIWLLGDDDLLAKDVINAILNDIEKNGSPSLIYLNYNEKMYGEGDFTSISGRYESGTDLFNAVTEQSGSFGPMMFMSASLHKTSHAKEYVEIFERIGEFEKGNLAFPLGLSLYSCLQGVGYIEGDTYLYDDIVNVSWKKDTFRVRFRDMMAIICKTLQESGLVANDLGIDIDRYISRYPECYYLLSGCKCDNYAFEYRLHNKPYLLIPHFAHFALIILKECFARVIPSRKKD